jgi:hypothetical protein
MPMMPAMKLNATTNPVIRAAHTTTITMSTATGSALAADERDGDQGFAYRRRASSRPTVSPRRVVRDPEGRHGEGEERRYRPSISLAATSDEGRSRRSVTCASRPSPGPGHAT